MAGTARKNQGNKKNRTLEAFLDMAEAGMASATETQPESAALPGEPLHRKLRVVVSPDRMEARLEAVFPDTTSVEVAEALRREQVVWGIRQEALETALEKADRTGRVQRDVPAAKGRRAIYRKQKQISYPFLEGLLIPGTGAPLHLGRLVFREIAEVMGRTDIERIRGYSRPVVAVTPGTLLMAVQGKDEIEPGRDVYGKEIRTVEDREGPGPLKAGEGVDLQSDGSISAARFGYVSVVDGFLSVVSPIWISPDRMEAYFVNPAQIGEPKIPSEKDVLGALDERGVCSGIDQEAVRAMCRDLCKGFLRESCVHIARGKPPGLSKGQIEFSFDLLPEARFEAVRNALRSVSLADAIDCEVEVQAVHAGAVLAEQILGADGVGPGMDLFGNPAAPPETVQDRKGFKAGIHVRREVEKGRIRYISERYGYAGVLQNRITVLSPIWISPDKMQACFMAYPQGMHPVLPTLEDVEGLLEQSRVRHGVDRKAVEGLCLALPFEEEKEKRAVVLARGTSPKPGQDGRVELFFKQMPDPGKLLEGDKMDFRERDAVPMVHTRELLARRTFPKEGLPGADVRGRILKPPRPERGLLYAGQKVVVEEKEDEQLFYATGIGWARVVRDTLSVMQRFRHQGDVDYQIGNIRMEGDVELSGTVKSGFKVEAAGNVYIGGAVERGAEVSAGGDVVVQRGIIGAKVKADRDLYARFIQSSEVAVSGNLVVRNYVQDSTVQALGRATVQGDRGGARQLCVLGGTLMAAGGIEAASIGSASGWQTRVIAGVNPEVASKLERYRKGLAFADMRIRRAIRTMGGGVGAQTTAEERVEALRRASPERRAFLKRQLDELEKMRKLKTSLRFYLEEFETHLKEIAQGAQIRVTGSVFPKVTVQIGPAYRTVEEVQKQTVFRLDRDGTRVILEPAGT